LLGWIFFDDARCKLKINDEIIKISQERYLLPKEMDQLILVVNAFTIGKGRNGMYFI